MYGVLFANGAVLFTFKTVGIVALVLKTVVIAVFALGAFERNFRSRRFRSHKSKTPYKKIAPLIGAYFKFNTIARACQ